MNYLSTLIISLHLKRRRKHLSKSCIRFGSNRLDYVFNVWPIIIIMKICSIASKRAAKEDAKFVQILNQPSKKLPIILRCLPKWRNSAKSGHTEHWPLLGTKQVVVVGMEIGTWKENEKMIFYPFLNAHLTTVQKIASHWKSFFSFSGFQKGPIWLPRRLNSSLSIYWQGALV